MTISTIMAGAAVLLITIVLAGSLFKEKDQANAAAAVHPAAGNVRIVSRRKCGSRF